MFKESEYVETRGFWRFSSKAFDLLFSKVGLGLLIGAIASMFVFPPLGPVFVFCLGAIFASGIIARVLYYVFLLVLDTYHKIVLTLLWMGFVFVYVIGFTRFPRFSLFYIFVTLSVTLYEMFRRFCLDIAALKSINRANFYEYEQYKKTRYHHDKWHRHPYFIYNFEENIFYWYRLGALLGGMIFYVLIWKHIIFVHTDPFFIYGKPLVVYMGAILANAVFDLVMYKMPICNTYHSIPIKVCLGYLITAVVCYKFNLYAVPKWITAIVCIISVAIIVYMIYRAIYTGIKRHENKKKYKESMKNVIR